MPLAMPSKEEEESTLTWLVVSIPTIKKLRIEFSYSQYIGTKLLYFFIEACALSICRFANVILPICDTFNACSVDASCYLIPVVLWF